MECIRFIQDKYENEAINRTLYSLHEKFISDINGCSYLH